MLRLASLAASIVAAALLLAGCGGAGKPRPDLLFVSTRSGEYAIWEMNADGSRQRRLTKGGSGSGLSGLFFQVQPAWSHDGRLIAYSGGGDIYVMNSAGKDLHRLTSSAADDTHPSFSPDGKRIVFQRGTSMWIMGADGSGAHRVTEDTSAERAPAWSPDGRWIAYSRDFTGTTVREIWLVHPDGSGARRLTALDASANNPAWSPNAKKIVFSDDARAGGFKLWEIGIDGKGMRRMTAAAGDTQEIDPDWSPNGGTIAYSSDGSIAMLALDTGDTTIVTESKNNDSSPAWNPVPPSAKGH